MEEDIEKALNNLWNSLDDEFFNITYSQEQMQEDIRLILNRYNYLDSKNENLINKYKEQEKMIELMIEYIKKTDFITEDYCFRREDCENVGGNRMCKECILDYFRKKAKGE